MTKKAKDTTEIFRLNNLNKTKEKEIEKVIYQIGLAIYSNKKDECTAMFPELMAQVETLQKEIAENKETIERLSTEEICPNCGEKLSAGAKFCIYCGSSTEAASVSVKTSGKKCSNCGSLLEEDAAFCTSCGTPVPKENTVVEPNVEEEKVEEISEDKECQTKEEEQKKTCIKCGTEIEEGDAFCLNCGEPVE